MKNIYKVIKKYIHSFWIKEMITSGFLILFLFRFNALAMLFEPLIGREKDHVEWAPLYTLAYEYLQVVLLSSLISLFIGFLVGSIVHVFNLKSLKELLLSIGSFGTTFPTIAVIALLVPSLGYGFKPVVVALVLYGVFPILLNTIKGLEQVDRDYINAAQGLGMTTFQQLYKVELPIAMPMIIAGIKTSFIINIAATTVGAVVGAGGLGMPIVSGIRTNDTVLIFKGAVPVMLIAMLANQLFIRLENLSRWRNT